MFPPSTKLPTTIRYCTRKCTSVVVALQPTRRAIENDIHSLFETCAFQFATTGTLTTCPISHPIKTPRAPTENVRALLHRRHMWHSCAGKWAASGIDLAPPWRASYGASGVDLFKPRVSLSPCHRRFARRIAANFLAQLVSPTIGSRVHSVAASTPLEAPMSTVCLPRCMYMRAHVDRRRPLARAVP